MRAQGSEPTLDSWTVGHVQGGQHVQRAALSARTIRHYQGSSTDSVKPLARYSQLGTPTVTLCATMCMNTAQTHVRRLLVPQAHTIDHHISSFDGIAHRIDSAACTPFPALSEQTQHVSIVLRTIRKQQQDAATDTESHSPFIFVRSNHVT